jgi:class 3 adenylate cyclase
VRRLEQDLHQGTYARLRAHLSEPVNPKITEHRGRIVKNTGDGFLVEFESVIDAVRCVVEVQRGMAKANAAVPMTEPIEFRIGINLASPESGFVTAQVLTIDGGRMDYIGHGRWRRYYRASNIGLWARRTCGPPRKTHRLLVGG